MGSLVTSNEFVATDFEAVFRARLEPPGLLWERAIQPGAAPVLSRDQRLLAVSETNRVLVLDAVTGETVREQVTGGEAPIHLAFSAEATRLAAVLSDRSVRVWQVDDGAVIATMAAEYSGQPEWHDAGTRLWLLSSTGRVTRWNLAIGEVEYDQTLPIQGANIVRALWLPDRSGVLLSLGDVGLELWRLDRVERVIRFGEEVGRACLAMAFSPGGDRLLLGRYDATLTVAGQPFFLDVQARDPGEVVVTALGPQTSLRWETRTDTTGWEPVAGQSGRELTLPAVGLQRWVRAMLPR